jgi:acetoacetyl-CoA synthetase
VLLTDAAIVLFDGNPGYPDMSRLWSLAEDAEMTCFGTSAAFIAGCMKGDVVPRGDGRSLSALRSVGSTGSPLSPEGFRWVYDQLGSSTWLFSTSGGTDLCTAFVGGVPTLPVYLGELQARSLGAAIESWDPDGKPLVDEVGELVITRPMPSMPVSFWNDPDGTRLREAYFEDFPGVWRHGDWVRLTPRGSYVIYGRSDSTLNRGGVRMGTADFYAVVEGFEEILDSLVIDTTELAARDEGALLCFVVLAPGASLEDVEPTLRRTLRSELSPRHVPDRFIVVDAVPRTLNGKKCEVPVKKILSGVAPDKAVSSGALQNPDALGPFLALAATGGA